MLLNTCKESNWSCNGLKVGTAEPGKVKRPCKSGGGSASNSAYHFVFHFNNSNFINPYNLDGPTNLSIGGTNPKQCCLAQGWNPRTLGRTHMWGDNSNNKIKIITNIGDKNGNNLNLNHFVARKWILMKNKAFTLIELLVVVAIIGILAAVGVTTLMGFRRRPENQFQK